MNRTRRAPPRTGCGSISPMNTAVHPGWSSSNMKGPAPDIIRWNSLETSLRDISPVMVTRHTTRSEEHTSELQSRFELVCRLLLEKKKDTTHHAGCQV